MAAPSRRRGARSSSFRAIVHPSSTSSRALPAWSSKRTHLSGVADQGLPALSLAPRRLVVSRAPEVLPPPVVMAEPTNRVAVLAPGPAGPPTLLVTLAARVDSSLPTRSIPLAHPDDFPPARRVMPSPASAEARARARVGPSSTRAVLPRTATCVLVAVRVATVLTYEDRPSVLIESWRLGHDGNRVPALGRRAHPRARRPDLGQCRQGGCVLNRRRTPL
jgi:hypothetical protein